jgi:23S rRNA (uracil1939-C5)-methyltransferase
MTDLSKNTIHTVQIEGYTSEGQGVAHIGGRVVFVKGALRGETCQVKILKCGKNVCYAKVEQILSPSPARRTPACPVFGKCGGCDLMHLDYEEELAFKLQRVKDALQRIGGLDVPVSGIVGSEITERYRNKAIYNVGEINGSAVTGFYRARSHDIVETDACLIQADVSDRAAAALRRWMNRHRIPAYDETTGKGLVRHLFCRYVFGTGRALITVVVTDRRLPHLNDLIDELLAECPETTGIVLNVNTTRGNTVLAGEFHTVWGDGQVEDTLCSLRFSLSPRSFYQINSLQAERLYEKAVEYAALTGSETVLDLYCGTGTISLVMAKGAACVIGAEIVEEAVEDARKNAVANGITNAEFICADASEAAAQLKESGIRPDVVVVDPPRKGLAPDVIDTIGHIAPDRVVYVSCDPATLARDLKLFHERGYKAQEATAFDMFPRCTHVETVAWMSRVEK